MGIFGKKFIHSVIITIRMGILYYGDNLEIMRKHLKDESVDLIYLDPPFNSKADYNVLFKEKSGEQSVSQIKAFTDFWHWDLSASAAYHEVVHGNNSPANVSTAIEAIVKLLGQNDMSAYLVIMTIRLLELKRVLKNCGSIYLHCDPTASHYLKVIMDQILGAENFKNEIIWKRTSAHNDPGRYGRVHDIILFYTKSQTFVYNVQYLPYSEDYLSAFYKYTDSNGRQFRLDNLANPHPGGYNYEYKGYKPPENGWRMPIETMEKWEREGNIYFPENKERRLSYKRFLDEMPGVPLQDIWDDISPIQSQSLERLGYPTQKPLTLLERIIQTSSNKGDVVLDPFCGCGTAIHAAQKLGRAWVGIDITHLAINLIKNRLQNAFNIKVEVEGEPKDIEGARALKDIDPFQFQWWALSLIGARPVGGEKKKGSDRGIDGVIYNPRGTNDSYYGIVQVKSGHVKSGDIRDFRGTIEREKADYGIFITLVGPTEEMRREALSAGLLKTIWGENMQKIQILTIEQLMSGARAEMPSKPDVFNRAQKEKVTKDRSGRNTKLD